MTNYNMKYVAYIHATKLLKQEFTTSINNVFFFIKVYNILYNISYQFGFLVIILALHMGEWEDHYKTDETWLI